MELRQLSYFVAVAEENSFTRGAQRLRVAQPAISQQIQRLERELGQTLFHRGSRYVTLTAAGQTLLPHARAALSCASRAKDAVAALGELLAGQLCVGLVQAQPDSAIAALLGVYHERYPNVGIALLEDDPPQLMAGVAAGRLDVAFAGLVNQPPEGLGMRPVATEPLLIAVRPGHPLAERTSVALGDLATATFACLVEGTGLRTVLEQQCGLAGFVPQIVAETTALGLLADLVACGVGVALIPATVVVKRHDIVTIPLTPPLERRIGLVWPTVTPMSPAGRAFLELTLSAQRETDSPPEAVRRR